jgi:DNA ligase-1
LYKSGRSNNLLKVKTFIDEECEIVGVEKAKGTEADAALLVVRDIRGNIFSVRPAASFEERRNWLSDSQLVIGRKATIVYQELSPYNIPRFPIVKAIRDYE